MRLRIERLEVRVGRAAENTRGKRLGSALIRTLERRVTRLAGGRRESLEGGPDRSDGFVRADQRNRHKH